MTHRQYLTWRAWMLINLDVPSRSDFYQMQTAALVESTATKRRVDVNKKKIRFGRPPAPAAAPTDRRAELERARQRAAAEAENRKRGKK